MRVVKFPGDAAERIARSLAEHGPSTAGEIAARLDLTPAGVRRPLQALMAAGLACAHDKAPYGPSPKRGRGRPSQVYALTADGRAACDQAYDDLAIEVLRYLDASFGADAVQDFAAARARRLSEALASAGVSSAGVAGAQGAADPDALAAALSAIGYAAEVEPLTGVAVQLCQHHCPVVDAAREFPALCEAETTELGRVLGTHVTRLATLAHGDEVCTTVIPVPAGPPMNAGPSMNAVPAVPAPRTARGKASA